ncbi:hypothetical protein [Halobaculum marinum]|uniref:Archaeal Type IV pilin N-terminal domain-containing protein n=1 Tax=Halobaculum marinum TaxID=3031996 RepID=A0ABD5X4W9_9EURY|nr:hypothetical protein [Halobaculum sp. DT55]
MSSDPDRQLTAVLVVVVALAAASVATLGYVAATDGDDGAEPMREVAWSVERANDTHVRVVHSGGPVVPSADLRVTVDGIERRPAWSATTLAEGDAGTVRADPGSRVTLLWDRSRVDTVVLARWTLAASDAE